MPYFAEIKFYHLFTCNAWKVLTYKSLGPLFASQPFYQNANMLLENIQQAKPIQDLGDNYFHEQLNDLLIG